MVSYKARFRRFLIAVIVVITHSILWFAIWNYTPVQSVAFTRHSGSIDLHFVEQYWIFLISLLILFGAWRGWSIKVFITLFAGYILCWLLRFGKPV